KQAGLHWRGGLLLSATSPGYENNDLGFQTSADRLVSQVYTVYAETRPGKVFRHYGFNPGMRAEWNFGGNRVNAYPYFNVFGQLLNYWTGSIYVARGLPTLDDRLTWGGPLAKQLPYTTLSGFLQSDPRKAVTLNMSVFSVEREDGGRDRSVGPSVTMRPASNWNVSLGPRWTYRNATAQYVATIVDPPAKATFGRRYVFADLEQQMLSLDTRLGVTFSPRLTLELYAQPFIASGDYGTLKELRGPRTFEFNRYGREVGTVSYNDTTQLYRIDPDAGGPAGSFAVRNRDFNLRSLRGNAVLRWEWRPGSTLYVAWQQLRSDFMGGIGNFDFGRDAGRLFQAQPDNIFLIKVNYWLNP
ncbi:MAG: DUF5916 domain-containing protein, partial [Gemmatimonadota bacterium]|nr:DUF5916 domain-containing protein [Gemmatimonadota bacterium]